MPRSIVVSVIGYESMFVWLRCHLSPHEILGRDLTLFWATSTTTRESSESYTTESYQFIFLMMHLFDLIDICSGSPVSDVYHRVELSHWTTLASAGVRYLFLVCPHYFEFLASRSDVGGETCYAETGVHADQTCNSVWGSSTPLTRTRKLFGVHREPSVSAESSEFRRCGTLGA